MKNMKQTFSALSLLAILAILTVFACKRELDDFEPAEFPTTAEVFIDGFSGGLNYGAFGGSDVTAFDVDTEVKYQGTASMKFAVPDFGSPKGAYAGGAYFTSSPRDLSGYDALTFWARASQAASIDVVGFGNDFGASNFLTTLNDVKVNTNWQKFIIPIPDASKLKQERGMFFYSEGPENGLGYTFWIDEVKFEKLGTIAHAKAAILDGQDQVISAETGQKLNIGGLKVTFNLPNGTDQSVGAAPAYFTFTSSNTSVATVNSKGEVTILSAGDAVVTAKLGAQDATGSLTLNSTGAAVGPTAPAPNPTISADSVISLFSNVYTNVKVDTWNTRWQFSTAEDFELQIAGNDVKRYRNLNFVGIEFAAEPINASSMTHFHLDIWTPDPTAPPKSFKVLLVDFGANGVFGGNDDSSHELSFTSPTIASNQWVSLDIPLSNFTGLTNRAHLAQLVLSGDLPNVYVDNVYFYKKGGTANPTVPTVAAPVPTRNPANVISIFSDTYTNLAGTDLNPNWGQATVVSQIPIAGNNTLFFKGLNYQGTQFGSNVDATSMTHLHLDFWSSNSSALNVFLISPGPIEKPVALTVPTNGWTSIDIPLANFSPVALNNLIQFKFEGNGDIYIDNLYFYKTSGGGGNAPTTAAPTPAFSAGDVISVFSDAYTNIAGTDLNPNWGQATQTTQVPIAGNNTLRYGGLNYQGMQLGSNQNVSTMTHLHLDFWSANSTSLRVFLISPGPAEKPYTLTVPTSGWTSIDIPLTEFTPVVNLSDVFQFKFEGNGDIYLDNILFHK